VNEIAVFVFDKFYQAVILREIIYDVITDVECFVLSVCKLLDMFVANKSLRNLSVAIDVHVDLIGSDEKIGVVIVKIVFADCSEIEIVDAIERRHDISF